MMEMRRLSPDRIGKIWLGILSVVCFILILPATRDGFKELTIAFPFVMGAAKIALLGSMGDLLAVRMTEGSWRISGLRLTERAFVWAFLGVVFVIVFPIFAAGTEALFVQGYFSRPADVFAAKLFTAFAASSFMNILFAPGMMVFHRVTDMAIMRGGLFRAWSPSAMLHDVDWNSMWRIAFPSIFWFWIPAHTVTFILPPEFRIVTAALLAIALGFILGFASRRKR